MNPGQKKITASDRIMTGLGVNPIRSRDISREKEVPANRQFSNRSGSIESIDVNRAVKEGKMGYGC